MTFFPSLPRIQVNALFSNLATVSTVANHKIIKIALVIFGLFVTCLALYSLKKMIHSRTIQPINAQEPQGKTEQKKATEIPAIITSPSKLAETKDVNDKDSEEATAPAILEGPSLADTLRDQPPLGETVTVAEIPSVKEIASPVVAPTETEEVLDIEKVEPAIPPSPPVDGALSQQEVAFIVDRLFREVMGKTEPSEPLFTISEDSNAPDIDLQSKPLLLTYENESRKECTIPLKTVLDAINWKNPCAAWGDNHEEQFKEFCKLAQEAEEPLAAHTPISFIDNSPRGSFVVEDSDEESEEEPSTTNVPISFVDSSIGKTYCFTYQYAKRYYKTTNNLLRNGTILKYEEREKVKIKDIDKYAKALLFATLAIGNELASLPEGPEEQTLIRTAKFDRAFVDANFIEGSLFVDPSFCSTSTKRIIVPGSGPNVDLMIKTCSGKSIKDFVALGFEKEVLLPPGRKFIVEKKEITKTFPNGTPRHWQIHLKEVMS